MSAKASPTLPNELWARVLKNVGEQELPEAWMSYRFVCSAFNTTIESIFRDQHLRKTWIRFRLGEHYDDDEMRVNLDVEFEFSHLSQDRCIAVFKTDCAEEIGEDIRGRLKSIALDDIDMPKHYVQVHRELNDTPIPGLSIDYEKLELSCDWHGLFTRFYGEEMLYHNLQAAWVEEKKDWATNMGKMALRGQLDMMQLIEKAVHAFGDAAEDSRYKARKARQTRQYKERGEEFVEKGGPAEMELVNELEKARQLASMESDSDYEEDDDESDEWQTDDSEGEDDNDEDN